MPLKTNKENQSIADYLLQIMPGLQVRLETKPMVNSHAARTLFSLWKNEKNKVRDGLYRRPRTMSAHQVETMSREGLAREIGSDIQITDKGGDVLKVMILGNDASIFDASDDRIMDYSQALANTKNAGANRSNSMNKAAASQWWGRFE